MLFSNHAIPSKGSLCMYARLPVPPPTLFAYAGWNYPVCVGLLIHSSGNKGQSKYPLKPLVISSTSFQLTSLMSISDISTKVPIIFGFSFSMPLSYHIPVYVVCNKTVAELFSFFFHKHLTIIN